jgi:hypothetical protein
LPATTFVPGLKTFASFADALSGPLADKQEPALKAGSLLSHAAKSFCIAVAIQLATKIGHPRRLGKTHFCIIAPAACLNRGTHEDAALEESAVCGPVRPRSGREIERVRADERMRGAPVRTAD